MLGPVDNSVSQTKTNKNSSYIDPPVISGPPGVLVPSSSNAPFSGFDWQQAGKQLFIYVAAFAAPFATPLYNVAQHEGED